jgi:hypothetical protein
MTEYDKIKFRDDCAIAAMRVYVQGYLNDKLSITENDNEEELISSFSFNIADAMLKEKLERDEKLS